MKMRHQIKSLCVFGGSSAGNDPVYGQAAGELGKQLANKKLLVIYGGGSVGMMGKLADAVLAEQGEVIGVIPEFLAAKELKHPGVKDMRVVPSMHIRKALMNELADGFIAMPGGLGTFEELLEVMTWAQLSLHHKPIGLLNTYGFYDPLITFLQHTQASGFITEKHLQLFIVEKSAQTLLEKMAAGVCLQQSEAMLPHAIEHAVGDGVSFRG